MATLSKAPSLEVGSRSPPVELRCQLIPTPPPLNQYSLSHDHMYQEIRAIRDFYIHTYGWNPLTSIIPNRLWVGGIYAGYEDPLSVFQEETFHRTPTLIVTIETENALRLIYAKTKGWKPAIEWRGYCVADTPSSNINNLLDDATPHVIDHLNRPNGRVFIHCRMGISRSVSLTTYCLMLHERITLRDALTRICILRPCACPNMGFLQQLRTRDIQLQERKIIGNALLPSHEANRLNLQATKGKSNQ